MAAARSVSAECGWEESVPVRHGDTNSQRDAVALNMEGERVRSETTREWEREKESKRDG